jgi:hypothetical protein
MANYKGLFVLLTITFVASGFASNVFPAAWMESGDNTTLPGPLVYHAIAEDSRGNLWLFGGVDPRTYFGFFESIIPYENFRNFYSLIRSTIS